MYHNYNYLITDFYSALRNSKLYTKQFNNYAHSTKLRALLFKNNFDVFLQPIRAVDWLEGNEHRQNHNVVWCESCCLLNIATFVSNTANATQDETGDTNKANQTENESWSKRYISSKIVNAAIYAHYDQIRKHSKYKENTFDHMTKFTCVL